MVSLTMDFDWATDAPKYMFFTFYLDFFWISPSCNNICNNIHSKVKIQKSKANIYAFY
jgi:hypothetical protein